MPLGSEQLLLLAVVTLDLFWAVEATYFEHPEWWTAALLFSGVALAWAVIRAHPVAPWLVLAHAAAVGLADRIVREPFVGSDVLASTREAIDVLASGGNPYAHVYAASYGAPFPYPPGEIAFYALLDRVPGGIESADKLAGMAIVLLLALLAARVGPAPAALGTALYGTFGEAAFRSVDGSNDTALALLVVLAVVLLVLARDGEHLSLPLFFASAAAFGWALLFKQTAWLLFPFVVNHLRVSRLPWRGYVAVGVGLLVLVSIPFFVTAPGPFVANIVSGATFHANLWGLNLWAVLREVAPGIDALAPLIPLVQWLLVAAIAVLLLRHPARSLALALLEGLAVLFVAFFFARWTTYPYYTFAGAVLAAAVALAASRTTAAPAG